MIILVINEVIYFVGLYVPEDFCLVVVLIVFIHKMLYAAMI